MALSGNRAFLERCQGNEKEEVPNWRSRRVSVAGERQFNPEILESA